MSLTVAAVEDVYRLSPLQEGILYHSLERSESDAYVVQLSCRLGGRLDVESLRRAWTGVIARHPALRTSFHWEETAHAVQVVHTEVETPWSEEDWRDQADEDHEARFRSWLRADRARGFDLTQAPLVRLALLRERDDAFRFVWTHHHLILDGWSLPIVLSEVFEIYGAERAGRPAVLQACPAFRTYIAWLKGRERAEAEAFWRGELGDVEAPTSLPLARELRGGHAGPPRERPREHAAETRRLPAGRSQWIEERARKIGVTPATLVRGAWGLLLGRLTGEREAVFGEVVSGRPADLSAASGMVGMFINTVPVRVALDAGRPVEEWLHALQRRAGERRSHEHLGLVEIQGWSGVPRGTPLFETLTIFENYPLDALVGRGAPDLEIEDVRAHEQTNYPLTLTTVPADPWLFRLEYDPSRYEPGDVSRLGRYLDRLLEELASRPEAPVGSVVLLGEEERRVVVGEWNRTEAPYPADRCVHELVEDQARLHPEAEAVRDGSGWVSYGELERRAEGVAGELERLGVGLEERVGVMVGRSSWMVAALLGVLKSGGAYVPLEESYPEERLRWMVGDCGIRVVVASEGLAGRARGWGVEVVEVEGVGGGGGERRRVRVDADQLAYVMYTSGSTGVPKGVMVPHRALGSFLHSMKRDLGFAPGDLLLAVTPITFDIAGLELFLPLVGGGRVLVADRDQAADGHALRTLLARERPGWMQGTPSTWHLLLDAGWRREDAPDLVALCGGEALSGPLAARLLERCPAVWNLYGPTETTIWSTCARVDGADRIAIGSPIANTRAYVVDADGNPAAIGAPGELVLGGDGLARGYLGRPAKTAERFVPDPFGPPGGRLYRTGDRVRRRPDGQLEFLGRVDDQLKVRGHRVEPGEIEASLQAHPAIGAAAVVASAADPGLSGLVAFVAAREGGATTPEILRAHLREHLRERLPDALVPSRIEILHALPRTSSGKVDRRALRTRAAEGPARPGSMPPRTPLEARLVELWQEVLGVERVGVADNFFQLGGHSISATRLVARVREAFGVPLSLRALLEHPTVSGVAAALEGAGRRDGAHASHAPALPAIAPDPAHRHDPFPLTDVQEAYWVGRSGAFELGRVATHAYAEVELESLDLERLERAWRRLIDRHDMLRAVILPEGKQRVLPEVPPYRIRATDLRGLPEADIAAALDALREELSHQILPSDRWPLFDVRAAAMPGGRTRLFTSFDLLIGDAWSFQVLGRELARLYEDPDAPLPSLEISFRDCVQASEGAREGDLHRASLAYWRERLATLPPPPDLPLAVSPSSLEAPRFTRRELRLEPDAWRRFRSFAANRGLTSSGAIAAAFAEVLAYWSAAPRFTLNLTLFHRPPLHPQIHELVGDFTSVNLLEVDLSGTGPFEDRARRIQARLWEDLDHSWVSGVQILRELSRVRGGAAVLMPVVFTSVLDLDPGASTAAPPTSLAAGRVVFSVTQTPQVWLDHQASEEGGALVASWDAVEALFPRGLLDAMFEAYGDLLRRLAADEGAWEEDVPDLRPPAQRAGHDAANATESPFEPVTIVEPFAAHEEIRPAHEAVIAPGRTLTYAELGRRSRELAGRLRQTGVGSEALVAIVMEKGWKQVVAALGVAASGAAYLPVDPALPKERIRKLLALGECRVAITDLEIEPRIDWPEGITRILERDEEPPGNGQERVSRDGLCPSGPSPDDLAYVIFTSGSTGEPKGVMIEHRAAANTIVDVNRRFGVGPGDRVLALSSLSFDLSVWDIFGALAAGAALVVPEPGAPDPARWASTLREHRITIWNSVPALMQLLVEYLEGRGERLPDSLRLALLSGDWIPVSLPDRIRALGPRVEVVSLGGATEASIWSILHRIEAVDPSWTSIPYGVAMANQRFYVLDHALRPRPDGVPGELHISGAGLARGYWRDEERTRERFPLHPRTGERLYRTGDLGCWRPDGWIEFVGRRDFQVKIQGYRIELGEIEQALSSHPGVRASVVAATGSRAESKRLIAYIVPARRPGPSSRELREHLERKLPLYMVPSGFVELDALPLSPNGKVDRGALPEPAAGAPPSRSPAPSSPSGPVGRSHAASAAPPIDIEPIARIVAEVIGAGPVDPEASLLEMGASSVDIVRVANRLERDLGFRPGIEAFYREPTVHGLARLLVTESGEAAPEGERARPAPASAPLILDPAEREAFRRRRPGLRVIPGARFELPDVGGLDSGPRHRSQRRFARRPVASEALGRLLACLRGIPEDERPRFRYGSAGGLYPVQVYLHLAPGLVEGVEPGAHYYHPLEHALVPLDLGMELPATIHEPFVNRPVAESAAFSIFLVGELAAIEPLYGEHSLRFATLEAGLMSQLLEMEAPSAGLGLCQIGTLDFERVRPIFRLAETQVFLNCLLGGRPEETLAGIEGAARREPSRVRDGREEFEL